MVCVFAMPELETPALQFLRLQPETSEQSLSLWKSELFLQTYVVYVACSHVQIKREDIPVVFILCCKSILGIVQEYFEWTQAL